MTISTEPTPLSYDGDDSTTEFPITWKYFQKSDVVATLRDANGVETVWVLDTDYTLTAAGVDAGGTLTATTAPATGETLVIDLDPPNTQDKSLPLGGSFPSINVEDALDRAAQRDAKIEAILDRALLVPKTDTQTGSLLALSIDSTRANKFLKFDANGSPTAELVVDQAATGTAADEVPTNADLRVTTLTALKALAAPAGDRTVFMLGRSSTGDGGEGRFTWRSGDQSTNVTNDPQNGIWVPPDSDTTGASGAWMRGYSMWHGINGRWFGASPSATAADNVTAINAFLKFVRDTYTVKSGTTVTATVGRAWLPRGDYDINATVGVTEAWGLQFFGEGVGATRLVWKGTGSTAFELRDSRYCKIGGFDIYVDPANTLDAAISSIQDTSLSNIAPTSNDFDDIYIVGNEVLQDAMLVDFTTTDANNDAHQFSRITAIGYTRAAAYLHGLQSHVNYFRNCNLNGLNLAQTAALASYGIYSAVSGSQSASFIVDGGLIGGHATADYHIGGSNQGCAVKGTSSENSDRLVTTVASTGSAHLLLENVRYASDEINADGHMIKYQMSGGLTIINSDLGTNGTASTVIPKILLDNAAGIFCRVIDTRFPFWETSSTNDSTDASPIVVTGTKADYADIKLEGCRFINGSVTTVDGYLRIANNPGATFTLNAHFGEVTHFLAPTAATTLTNINPAYPNQEISLLFENTDTTVQHNAGGAGTILLKAGADFTPLNTPHIMKLKFSNAFNRWVEFGDVRAVAGFSTFTDGDATPGVSGGNVFKTANTAATTITALDSGVDGQTVKIVFGDANTTVDFTATSLKGNAGVDWTPATNDHMTCVYDGTNWYCDISDNTA